MSLINSKNNNYLVKYKNNMLPLSPKLYDELVKDYSKRLEI